VILLLGVVLGMLVAGLAVPFVFGERLSTSQSSQELASAPGDAAAPVVVASADPGTSASAAPSPKAGPVAPGTADNTTAAGAGALPGQRPGSVGSGTAPDGAKLTATDRGVTAKTVKVGFTALDTGGLGKVGVGIGVTVEQQRAAWIAYAKEINARGGLNGRAIQPVVVSYDPLDENTQRSACLQLTQDEKVFAVVGGFNRPSAVSCVVRENQTPLFSGYPATSDEIFQQAGSRFVTMYPRASRMMATTVAALDNAGKLKGRTIGILNQQANDPGAKTSAALEAAIKARGYSVKRRADLAADDGTSASQVPVTVNQFQAEGINTVFVLAAVVTATQFVQQADNQGYRPAYHLTDWANDNNDFAVSNMPASFDGNIGTTQIVGHANKVPFGKEGPEAARCRQVYDKYSGKRLAARGTAEYGTTMQGCDSMLAFEKAAKAAGAQLTRTRVGAAVPSLGRFPIANWGAGGFAAGKYDFSDQVRFHVFRSSCSCWQPSGGFFTPR
jgi:ABC-type branched-subunit amino acid transport system substrate-binding protein